MKSQNSVVTLSQVGVSQEKKRVSNANMTKS
uniref:Uncharacterized protein n=1 Tax=Rhizophora mucronata TaxID=61149 RepID=A0A2P2N5J5_RHIMU